jgi:predicted phosphodiesterase
MTNSIVPSKLNARSWGAWAVAGIVAACAISAACAADTDDDFGLVDNEIIPDGPTTLAMPLASTIPTEPNLKVAFIGDTAAGNDFKRVLDLVKREGADLVMVQGDLTYGNSATDWFRAIDAALLPPAGAAGIRIPYFVSKGNHDSDWGTLGGGLKTRLAQWNIVPTSNDPTTKNYAVAYKGLQMVMVSDKETQNPSRDKYVEQQLAEDKHIWKICSWHRNQRQSNVGPKGDEMGWAIYETCRRRGAIVAQGHSHTYSRSKTLTVAASQTIDAECNSPFDLCVGPGKDFFFDSSIGGNDLRSLNTSVASKPHFASAFSGDYGALFIEFNVDGDPRKARGYFKTVGNVVIDPPASSGRQFFTVTSSN